jgi:hypothetical protein
MPNFADKILLDFESPLGISRIFNNFRSNSDMLVF